jgi:hypothetical protein
MGKLYEINVAVMRRCPAIKAIVIQHFFHYAFKDPQMNSHEQTGAD